MEYQIIDLDTATEEELLSAITANIKTARLMSSEIEKLRQVSAIPIKRTSTEDEYYDEEIVSEPENIDREFEDEVDYYYQLLKSHSAENLESEITRILPSRLNYNYSKILYRMKAEVLKNIKDIKDLIASEGLSLADAEAFSEDLQLERERLRLLDLHLQEEKEDAPTETIENKLIFIPTPSGNIHVIDALEGIDPEYYERFQELFLSIKNGTFKGVKRFTNNNALNGLSEVRGNQVRVIYARISSDCYAMVSAFIKKTNKDQGYFNYIVKHARDYTNIEDTLKGQLEDPEFIKLNSDYEQELFRILGNENSKSAQLVKKEGGVSC